MSCSFGSYVFALLQPAIGDWFHISDDFISIGILIWILAGAISACMYGNLPEPDVSDELLNELQKIINAMKKDEQ